MAAIKFTSSELSLRAKEFLSIVHARHSGCIQNDTIIVGEKSDDLSMRISCNSAITWLDRCKKYGYTSGSLKIIDIEKSGPFGPIPTDEFLEKESARIIKTYGELPSSIGTHQATYTGRNLRNIVRVGGNEALELLAADFFSFLREGDLQ